MILSPCEEKDRRYIRIQYAAKPGDKKRYHPTKIPKDLPEPEKRRRVALAMAELQATLLRGSTVSTTDGKAGNGWVWVHPWLSTKYGAKAKKRTLEVYSAHWKQFVQYFAEANIPAPSDLLRQHGYEYVNWRTSTVKEKSGRSPARNTAINELKLLARVMDEAKERGYVTENPVRKLGIEGEERGIKPEFTEEHISRIYAALKMEPRWMQRSFHIALNTGIRFAETRLARNQVRWETEDLLIEKPKGGVKREFSIPIYPAISGMLREWWESGEEFLWTAPAGTLTGLTWSKFFKEKLKFPDYCFHCTRVTFITAGMRAGIPESVMMKMVNHASTLINRIYQRWTHDDVRRFVSKVPSRSLPGAT